MPEERLAAILSQLARSTGQSYNPSDFASRLRIQKSIYLLKALGYNPVSRYSFGAYVRGPYSPDLARDYYALPSGIVENTAPVAIPSRYLGPVVDAVKRGNDFLEAVATLHLYCDRNRNSKRTDILDYVRYLKPELGDRLAEALAFLEKKGFLPAYT